MKNDYKLNQDGITVGDQVYMYSAIDSIKIAEKYYLFTIIFATLGTLNAVGSIFAANVLGILWGAAFIVLAIGYQLFRKKQYFVKIVVGNRAFKVALLENKIKAEMLQEDIKKRVQSIKK